MAVRWDSNSLISIYIYYIISRPTNTALYAPSWCANKLLLC